ncbi:MAG: hypothetical protein QOE48_4230 [Mycobacterium sp.]|jgi:hypothetical protein|nr:hypothetical protein [Mycobacterium sp.]MDT5254405.1 hypothetical protein [Mycobacterium sp.]MDT5275401.1 hypothetical protein [Mycobacterium sp.]MDT5308548.1 hypothetical protein [Mycobacterium sp.]MDT5322115.1 hypothetical protein [Mycobacterium sp.]
MVLVEKHSSDTVVALVQTASLGPTLLFALFAGVLADLFDRRRLLIVVQTYAVLVAVALALLTYLGRVGPTSLLMFTLAIGCASALAAPAWQAIQPEVVPREQIPAVSNFGQRLGKCRPCDWTGDRRRDPGIIRARSGLRDQRDFVRGNHRCLAGVETTQANRATRTRTLRPSHRHRIGIR